VRTGAESVPPARPIPNDAGAKGQFARSTKEKAEHDDDRGHD
jgi:hypothetical protein